MSKTLCEFCGEMRNCASTMFNGEYCTECYKTLIEHSRDALREIKKATEAHK